MVSCVLCGSKNGNRKAEVEGSIISVCNDCVKFGKEVAVIVERHEIKRDIKIEINDIVEELPQIIKKQREKRGLKQEELASKIGIKHNLIKRIEEGWFPDNHTAKKLEKFLKINIIENGI